jgi:hypothetical protein
MWGVSGIFVIKTWAVRCDAYSGMPHSAIFQANSIKILKRYPGAFYSAVERMGEE